jgi:hypothetical protein
MADLDMLNAFDECIEDLAQEIKEIEEGVHDSRLDFLISYPIKPEYLSKMELFCRFPSPPGFKIVESAKSGPAPAERRTSRVVRKRRLDGDDSPPEVCSIELSNPS